MTKWTYFDVDDTLVMWDEDKSFPKDTPGTVAIEHDYGNCRETFYLKPHTAHINKIQLLAARPKHHVICVWSKGGARWAREVVEALGLLQYVSHILQKPDTIYDDLPSHEWMPTKPRFLKSAVEE